MPTSSLATTEAGERLLLRQLNTPDFLRDFREDVAAGLSAMPKSIPPKFFYDALGSRLFERITRTPEYYPTRTETEILTAHAAEMVGLAGESPELVELGSGSSVKTRLLLDALAAGTGPMRYVPVDISPSAVTENAGKLLADYPRLEIEGLICDYERALKVLTGTGTAPRLFAFLGSSLGNFEPPDMAALLRAIAAAMGPEDHLLLGVDLKKGRAMLERAYNDAEGVTAAFNLNLLAHINAALGGHFDLNTFRHHAFFNEARSRIEMHLVSEHAQQVAIDALEMTVSFAEGETIHTENSHKPDREALAALFAESGLARRHGWSDANGWFTLEYLAPDR